MWRHPTRDALMFILGAIGFLHETFLSNMDRPYVIAGSLALMGLPFVLAADRAVKREATGSDRGSK